MGSCKPSDKLVLDALRQEYVPATPEEIVRQSLVQRMIFQLGYPKELLVIEKTLQELPHLSGVSNLPDRRVDILCYAKKNEELFPLLLIECKRGGVLDQAAQQVMGYHHFIRSQFVAVAGKDGVKLIYPQAVDFLPLYSELLRYC